MASTVTTSPLRSVFVASCVPTTHGMPSSRETIAAWHVMPPESVTIAEARRINGTQSGAVMRVTSTAPSLNLPASASAASRLTGPLAMPGSGTEAAQQRSSLRFRRLDLAARPR